MLNLTKTLRVIRMDERSLQLQKLRKIVNSKTKEERTDWVFAGWYGDIKSACINALKKELFDSIEEEQDIKSLIKELDNAKKEILQALKEQK